MNSTASHHHRDLTGQSFRDQEGHRWWVRGPRPGPEGQFVIEAEMAGSYPRIALYTMTETEFRDHARSAGLKAERAVKSNAARLKKR